jgi:hypothetical protein
LRLLLLRLLLLRLLLLRLLWLRLLWLQLLLRLHLFLLLGVMGCLFRTRPGHGPGSGRRSGPFVLYCGLGRIPGFAKILAANNTF